MWLRNYDKSILHRVIRNDCRCFNNSLSRCNPTPCDFFLWVYVKDQVYVPPLPASIPELKVRITADMLQTWNELDYRVHVCRITKGAPESYVTKTWECCSIKSKKYIHCYLKFIVYDKLLKLRQSFRITLYFVYWARHTYSSSSSSSSSSNGSSAC